MNPYAIPTDAELAEMIERAWYDAARAWAELRAYRAGAGRAVPGLDAILASAADSAEAYYHTLVDERQRRKDAAA